MLTRTRDWLGERLPRVTSRGVIILLVGVLAVILGAGLAIVSLIGTVEDGVSSASASAKQTHDLARQLEEIINRNHKDRLADQAVTDRKIRDIICVFISLDSHARARLLPLLPANYARTQCGARMSKVSPRPQGAEPGPTPGASSSVPGRPPPSRQPGPTSRPIVATRTATHTATTTATRTVTPPRPSAPPILDTPVVLCAVEKVLGLRCTP